MNGPMKTLAILVVLAAACSHKNDNYCPGANPDNNCLEDAAGDGSGSNQSCPAIACATGVCDTTSHMCVQCTSSETAACMDTTPICGSNDSCRPCAAHSECPTSNVCLPTGACGDATQIAYVDSAGTVNAVCSQAMPCTTIAAALATGRTYIKITGTISEPVSITTTSPVSFLSAPGAQLTESSVGPIMTITGTANVSIYDLDIFTAAGANGDGIYMPTGTPTVSLHRVTVDHAGRYGVYALAGTVNIERSTISKNTGGGLNLNAVSFDIKNSFITENPGVGTGFGGILINQAGATHSIEFTTIANNGSNVSLTNGVTCSAVGSAITFSNNIIYGNINDAQVFGPNCNFTFSDIGPTAQNGLGNLNVLPAFIDATTSQFHLMTSSPVKDMADPAAGLAIDFDGNPRPQGAHSDMGADEVMP